MLQDRRSFLKHTTLAALGLSFSKTHAKILPPLLARATPESQGVSSRGILDFLDAVEREKFELHSFMMLRHGHVIAEGWWEPYDPEFVHTMYSMSKSFTSTAVGFAVSEGKISVDDKVVSFFPDRLPEKVSENLAAMRIRDLLTMSSGHEKEPTQTCVASEDWVRTFLSLNIAHAPGTQFMYNSAATYMCAAIVEKVTGEGLLKYLTPRLFTPLGISEMRWETCPRGVATGGWGLSIQSEGLAKFGQLLLQKGQWQGKQIIPAAWIEEATRKHIQQPGGDKPDSPKAQNDWLQGYGYQFWRCQGTAYRGDGAFGQYTIVLPEQDAVIVMTSENKNMQGQIDLVWKHLLPAFGQKSDAETALAKKLTSLKISPPAGKASSKAFEPLFGKNIALDKNDLGFTQARFDAKGDQIVLTLQSGSGEHQIAHSTTKWHRTEATVPGTPPRLISGGKPKVPVPSKIAAHAIWTDDHTLRLTWRYYETPHSDTLTCRIMENKLTLSFLDSLTAMNPKAKDKRAVITGVL